MHMPMNPANPANALNIRTLLSILAIAASALWSVNLVLAAAPESVSPLYHADFEDCPVGQKPAGWSDGMVQPGADVDNATHVFMGASSNKSGIAPSTARREFPAVKGPLSVQFHMRTLTEKTFSVFFTLHGDGKDLCKVKSAVGGLTLQTIAGSGNGPGITPRWWDKPPKWVALRLEFDSSKESYNCHVYLDGKPVKILSIPGLYTATMDGISFGRMAVIDDLEIASGEGAFRPIENPEKYFTGNTGDAAKRTAAQRLPEGADPFQLFLKDTPPKILKTVSEETLDGIHIRRMVFEARPGQPQYGLIESDVYAILARPAGAGPFPGILILHGGMGSGAGEEPKVLGWAKRGYLAMAIDVPGVADPTRMIYSQGVARTPYGSNRMAADPDAASSPLFDAQLAGMRALELLRSQPDVKKDRIGLAGISWGGFTTIGVAGLAGNKLRAVFAVYGCGFLDLTGMNANIEKMPAAERDRWLAQIDAGRKANNIRAPFFIDAPANDGHFWPPAILATLAEIPGEKNQLITPNESHKAMVPGGTKDADETTWLKMEIPFFDYHLKGAGSPLPVVTAVGQPEKQAAGKNTRVRFTVKAPLPLTSVKVFCNAENEPEWPKRKWVEVAVKENGALNYTADLPTDGASDLYWFAMVSDSRPVTVSTPMQKIASTSLGEKK